MILIDAVKRAEKGLIDANLGNGVIKQRIARIGQGKSGGYRTIIVLQHGKRAFFVFGFSKNNKENLSQDEEEAFKKMSKHLLLLSEVNLSKALARGDYVEIKK